MSSYPLLLSVVVSGIAAVFDLRTGKIPNWLTIGSTILGLVLQASIAWMTQGRATAALTALGLSVGGGLLCLAVPIVLFRLRAMGGGDVKLFAAIGSLCLPTRGLSAETYSFTFAILLAPVALAYRGQLWSTLGRTWALVVHLLTPRRLRAKWSTTVPNQAEMTWLRLGPAIFLGTLTMYLT